MVYLQLQRCLVVITCTSLVSCETAAVHLSTHSVYTIQPPVDCVTLFEATWTQIYAIFFCKLVCLNPPTQNNNPCCCNLPLVLLAEWLGYFSFSLLCASAVTGRWNRYLNKSKHRKLTLELLFFILPLLPWLEPETVWSWVWCCTSELSLLPSYTVTFVCLLKCYC